MKVKNVIFSKQPELSSNFKKFIKIINEKNVNTIIVEKGDKVNIEKDLYFDILWPNTLAFVNENELNNNALVCKLNYKNFKMLFTGDIEEEAEKKILEEYKNDGLKTLNATVLKVGHHGSKTSSTQEFLKTIKPKIALIGVGKNNLYGHPNSDVLDRLDKLRSIYL